jgi:hypothetical protein
MSVATFTHTAIIVALFALPTGGMIFLGGRQAMSYFKRRRLHGARGIKVAKRKCRYCLLGRARLTEQTARVEADDLVTLRCWVCGSCGLPHWTVTRSPVLKPVNTRE